MCGRYNLTLTPAELREFFDLFRDDAFTFNWEPRFNIAPTQQVVAIRNESGTRHMRALRWGLIPGWAKDIKSGARMINLRSDTLAEKPTFKSNLRRKRCLIPATGFYEWTQGSGKSKQPFHIHRRDERPMAFAGVWDRWEKNEPPIETCSIITTDANPVMQPFHDRMPVILPRELWSVWLDPEMPEEALLQMLVPLQADDLIVEPVSSLVNNVRNEGEQCLAPPATDDAPPPSPQKKSKDDRNSSGMLWD